MTPTAFPSPRRVWRALLLGSLLVALGPRVTAAPSWGAPGTPAEELLAAARERASAGEALLPLGDVWATEEPLVAWEPLTDGRVMNLMRLVADDPKLPAAYARLMSVMLRGGRVHPVLKQAMGLRVASVVGSPYLAAHMARGLSGTPHGRSLRDALDHGSAQGLAPRDAAALLFAATLAQGPAALDDMTFAEVRRHFDDAEMIELTMVVCAFDYFARLAEAARLPVEPWALEPAPGPFTNEPPAEPRARVSIMTTEEMEGVERRLARRKDPAEAERRARSAMRNLGGGVGGSGGAMMRVPDLADAWGATSFNTEFRSGVSEVLLNFVSDAVSVQNQCYYCQTHQLFKLHNLGVSAEKMAQVRLSDAALSADELPAVQLGRQVTTDPRGVTPEMLAGVVAHHGEAGARDIILQACRFNFMNRFTGGLRLPPEENPRKVYDEVVGLTRTLAAEPAR